MSGVGLNDPSLTWSVIGRLKEVTNMKVIIKGIEVGIDASLAVENGADGIWVSNHGGRAIESDRGAIECLPEIVDAVNGRAPIIIDSGFRRGTDVYKALALGASAVGCRLDLPLLARVVFSAFRRVFLASCSRPSRCFSDTHRPLRRRRFASHCFLL